MNIERVEIDRDSRSSLCLGVDAVRGIVPVVVGYGGTLLGYPLSKTCGQGSTIGEISV